MKLFAGDRLQSAHAAAAEKALRARDRLIPSSPDMAVAGPEARAASLLTSLFYWCDLEQVSLHDALEIAEQWFLEDVDGGV
jgi:hypothetical protein